MFVCVAKRESDYAVHQSLLHLDVFAGLGTVGTAGVPWRPPVDDDSLGEDGRPQSTTPIDNASHFGWCTGRQWCAG